MCTMWESVYRIRGSTGRAALFGRVSYTILSSGYKWRTNNGKCIAGAGDRCAATKAKATDHEAQAIDDQ